MNKKSDIGWEQIGKLILAVAILLILIIVIALFKDKILDLFDKFKEIIRFGR